jgi:hypothetical protein
MRSVAGLGVVLALAVASPASAARVTGVSVTPTHIVGGTTQQASATITVAFEPGENTNAPYEWSSYHIYSVVLAIDDADHWGQGYFYCFNYVSIGSNSVTCQIPQHWAVPVSETHTLLARAGNINYPPGGQYNNDPGMTTTLTVDPLPAVGTIRVLSNLSSAGFSVSGPATYSGTTPFTQTNAPAGTYTATFNAVPGYTTPAPVTRTLTTGGTITLFGSYAPASRSLRVRASLDRQTFLPAAGAALPSTAHVPLGGLLDLQAIDQDGRDVPATFTLGTAAVEPDVAADALYKNATLLRFTTAAGNAAQYQSVHRGTVAITITPSDSSVPGGTLTVRVEAPAALGTKGQDLDPDLDLIAHRYGAPPQFIKAHADKESTGRFNRLAYRYEPIGPYVGDLLAVSRGKNLRTVAPYKDYRFETIQDSLDPALPFGSLVALEDLNARNGLMVGCNANGSGGHPLTQLDPLPTAWEIFRCNDAVMNWTVRARAAGPARARSLRTDPFTAQTSLASSYGLLQMTYVTAIDQMKWTGDSFGLKNPSALFDTFDNHLREAGSLSVGTRKVLKDLKNAVDVSRIDTYQALLDAFVRAWGRYNPGEAGYGQSVAGRVPQYPSTGASPVLGGGQ